MRNSQFGVLVWKAGQRSVATARKFALYPSHSPMRSNARSMSSSAPQKVMRRCSSPVGPTSLFAAEMRGVKDLLELPFAGQCVA